MQEKGWESPATEMKRDKITLCMGDTRYYSMSDIGLRY